MGCSCARPLNFATPTPLQLPKLLTDEAPLGVDGDVARVRVGVEQAVAQNLMRKCDFRPKKGCGEGRGGGGREEGGASETSARFLFATGRRPSPPPPCIFSNATHIYKQLQTRDYTRLRTTTHNYTQLHTTTHNPPSPHPPSRHHTCCRYDSTARRASSCRSWPIASIAAPSLILTPGQYSSTSTSLEEYCQ